MKIYHIDSHYTAIKKGVTNHDYRITGRKNFWIWPGGPCAPPIPLIINKDLIKRVGKRGELRFIQIKKGRLKRQEPT